MSPTVCDFTGQFEGPIAWKGSYSCVSQATDGNSWSALFELPNQIRLSNFAFYHYRLTHPSLNWVFDQGCQQIYFSFIGSLIQPTGLSLGWCWLFQRYIWPRLAHRRTTSCLPLTRQNYLFQNYLFQNSLRKESKKLKTIWCARYSRIFLILNCDIIMSDWCNRINEFPFSLMNELGFILEPSFFCAHYSKY